MKHLFLGFDPGGRGKFGCAALLISTNGLVEIVNAECVSDAQSAINWAEDFQHVAAAGIDTLLGWSRTGSRKCDRLLRKRYARFGNSVVEQNSLYSAMTLNGAIVAAHLFQKDTPLYEAHPKLLLKVLADDPMLDGLRNKLEILTARAKTPKIADDMRDAAVSAWAASCGYFGHWQNDLYLGDELWFPAWQASYPWPT
jgi:predicted nuclease with RNAse H fold